MQDQSQRRNTVRASPSRRDEDNSELGGGVGVFAATNNAYMADSFHIEGFNQLGGSLRPESNGKEGTSQNGKKKRPKNKTSCATGGLFVKVG